MWPPLLRSRQRLVRRTEPRLLRGALAIAALLLSAVGPGCAQIPPADLFVAITIGHTSAGDSAAWIVDGHRMRIEAGATPRVVVYEADLAPADRARILAALHTPEVDRLRGQHVAVSTNPDGLVLSDFAYVSVALKRPAGSTDSILFIGQASDIPLPLVAVIDSLFPIEKRFIRLPNPPSVSPADSRSTPLPPATGASRAPNPET